MKFHILNAHSHEALTTAKFFMRWIVTVVVTSEGPQLIQFDFVIETLTTMHFFQNIDTPVNGPLLSTDCTLIQFEKQRCCLINKCVFLVSVLRNYLVGNFFDIDDLTSMIAATAKFVL